MSDRAFLVRLVVATWTCRCHFDLKGVDDFGSGFEGH